MNILFLGGDKRMSYAAEYLSADHNVFFSNENFPINERFPVIVLPFPLTRDGKTVFSAVSPAIPFDEIPRFAELGSPVPGALTDAVAPVAPGAQGTLAPDAPVPGALTDAGAPVASAPGAPGASAVTPAPGAPAVLDASGASAVLDAPGTSAGSPVSGAGALADTLVPGSPVPGALTDAGALAPGAPAGALAPGASAGAPVPVAPAAVAPDAPVVLAGGSCPRLSEVCGGLSLVNYAASETLTLRNAALTAEAAVSLLIESCDGSLLGSRALILGYGRIARALAARLNPFGCEVTVGARRPETRAEAELNGCKALSFSEINTGDYDYIINTVPAPLLTAEDISHIKPGAVFLELATLPNSPPAPHIKYIHGAGLPGRCSPKTAGKYIAEELSRLIQERTEP